MASTINAKNTSSGVVITPDASGQLELQTVDITRMTIDVNGNVGVGTNSPTALLQTFNSQSSGTTAAVQKWSWADASNSATWGLKLDQIHTGSAINYSFRIRNNSTTDIDALYIQSNGNVGIGTTTPNGKVDSSWATGFNYAATRTSSSGYNGLAFYENTTNTSYLVEFGSGAGGGQRLQMWTNTAFPIAFGTNNTERMRIDSSGNVGIGTSSPTQLLDVTTGSGGSIAITAKTSTSSQILNIGLDPTNGAYFGTYTNQGLRLITNSSERMRITSNGGISFGSSGTNFGTSGQVLQSNGDAAPSWTTMLGYTVVLFASSGSWTVPAGVTTAKVTVCGGGGGSSGTSTAVIGGQGGFASAYLTGLTPGSSITVTIGAGGSSGSSATAGGTTSFGSFLSATGGTAGSGSATNGTRGTGTVSSGTNLGTGAVNDGGSATEGSFAVTQYGFAFSRFFGAGRNAAVAWSPTLGMHPGAAGVGNATVANRSGAVGGFVAIEY